MFNPHWFYPDIFNQLNYKVTSLGSQSSVPDSSEGINENIIDDPQGLGFTCGLCGKGFGVNRHHCRRHIKNSHKQVTEVLSCDYCQRTYKNKDSLKDHQRKNHGLYKL